VIDKQKFEVSTFRKSMGLPALRRSSMAKAAHPVPYLSPSDVQVLSESAKKGRHGERDSLLIILLFQSGLRISEALSLTPSSIEKFEGGNLLSVIGKGKKPRGVAIPQSLADKLRAYAYEHEIEPQGRLFPFKRCRGWQIIKRASERAGFSKRVYPHLFRHSDAIERLKQTGNPKALQHHLGHASTLMTMRYLSTLTQEDSIRINQEVQFG
jgi:integrase